MQRTVRWPDGAALLTSVLDRREQGTGHSLGSSDGDSDQVITLLMDNQSWLRSSVLDKSALLRICGHCSCLSSRKPPPPSASGLDRNFQVGCLASTLALSDPFSRNFHTTSHDSSLPENSRRWSNGISFWGDENVLEWIQCGGCPTL